MGSLYTYVHAYCGEPPGLKLLLFQAGLLSAVLTAFIVPKIQDLKVNPAGQSVYYQNQSVVMLDRISHQIASVDRRNFSSLSPYPTFHISPSDRRANILWLISLVCSLSAALLATLVQQWVRAYMRIFQQSSKPLKTARIRQFLSEGVERLPLVAEAVPGLIHVSLILFFWGLCDIIFQIDMASFVATVVPIVACVCLYLRCVFVPIWNPQSPYRTPFSGPIWYLIQNLPHSPHHSRFRDEVPATMEKRQEESAMKMTEHRRKRDVRAIQWLVDNINGSNETENFVLAIPGSFNQEWGREVWKKVVRDDQSSSTVDPQTQPLPGLPFPHEGTTVRSLSRGVRNLLKIYSNEGDFMDANERRKRMRLCVETVASLVCCTDSTEVELGLFGEVGEVGGVLSELGNKERTFDPLTIRSNPSFTVRWTCLSLVAVWKMLDSDSVQEAAKFALDGIPHYGGPDTIPSTAALRIDDYLTKAWASVVDLHLAFKPWKNRTESEIKDILNDRDASQAILELERIANEADELKGVDWRISLLQETMDGATHKLTRCLPGVFFTELKTDPPIMIREAFDFSSVATTPVPPQLISDASPVETTPVLPQLIFPGQQIQSLCTFGGKLRNIMEGQNTEKNETLKSLESLHEIPVALRGLNYLMKRQLWRLMDLCDGGGLGFTIELFFLALRQFSPTPKPTPLSSELKDFYTGTFKVITSNWKTKNSVGTLRILLDLLCDLVIRSRGVFSNISYPSYIVDMLLGLVGEMVEKHIGSPDHSPNHFNDVIQELEDIDSGNRVDNGLRVKVLSILPRPTASSSPAQAQAGN